MKGNSSTFTACGAGFQTSKKAAMAASRIARPHFHVDGCQKSDWLTSQIIIDEGDIEMFQKLQEHATENTLCRKESIQF